MHTSLSYGPAGTIPCGLIMLSNISSYFHVLISLGALLTSSNSELLSPETDGVFSHCFRKSINFFYKGPGSNYFRFLGHIWFLEQILFVSVLVCSFTCFTSLGTYENHSQLTGHERLTPDQHYLLCDQPDV